MTVMSPWPVRLRMLSYGFLSHHVAVAIINPRKEYWPSNGSNQRPPVLKSGTLLTELWDSAKGLSDFTDKQYNTCLSPRNRNNFIFPLPMT